MTVISSWDLNRPLKFQVLGLENLRNCPGVEGPGSVYIQGNIYEGETLLLSKPIISMPAMLDDLGDAQWPNWGDWFDTYPLSIAQLPRSAKFTAVVYYSPAPYGTSRAMLKATPIAWANIPLFDYKHQVRPTSPLPLPKLTFCLAANWISII